MKTVARVGAALLALPAGASAATVAQTDFLNFTYPFGDERVTVTNGEFTRTDPGNSMFFQVLRVARGDLGLDGSPDAVVVTGANTGGTGFFTDGLVYVDGPVEPALLATLGIGDRADGGVFDARIVSGRIVSERFAQVDSGACCPTEIDTTVLRRSGSRLVRVGPTTRRAYVYAGQGTTAKPVKLKFLRGTSTGTAGGDGFQPEQVAFDGARGQRLSLYVRRPAQGGTSVPVRVDLRRNGRTLLTLRAGRSGTLRLPATGGYRLRFSTTAPASSNGNANVAVDIRLR